MVGWPEGETPPGRKSRGRSAFGEVHGATLLVRGMQRGAKLPPCQDERTSVSVSGGKTAAHLASGIAMAFSVVYRFGFSARGPQNKTETN